MRTFLLIVGMSLMATLTASNKGVKRDYGSNARYSINEQAEKIVHDVRVGRVELRESWRKYHTAR